ncbi:MULTISPECIES: hypothetical protein [Citrobacter]|uniref:hypothetical protein n=2 Tax=Enterobacteriaceae TaxID=543 RepID=UPI0008DDE4BB|nr:MULTISPECIES: hypothetical protein [Citrobacter]AYY74538.1 hypothetical protein EGX86_12020 [Citrobacter koseri]EKW5655389.1 hypothetical protein [Citrobacter koseri]EKY0738351.1 hypothetical protein [Citrobacter koseri]MBE0023071.1 hypothetical protein [Citrobacter koseri]MBE0083776.1 hypothetical protein [Citrobacter koseri]
MCAFVSKKTGEKTNHPVVNYVNNVNKRIADEAVEFSQSADFYIMETASGSRGFVTTNEKRTVLEELNKGFRFYLRDEISKPEVIDLINEFSGVEYGSFGDIFKLEESNDLVLSACIMHFMGLDSVADNLLKIAFYNENMKLGQLHFVYHSGKVVERLKQRKNSSQPRNPNYAKAIRILKDTWEKYPAASKNEMLSKLHQYFNGSVSKDSIKRWIKKSKLQPPKPDKYTAFSLVINSD